VQENWNFLRPGELGFPDCGELHALCACPGAIFLQKEWLMSSIFILIGIISLACYRRFYPASKRRKSDHGKPKPSCSFAIQSNKDHFHCANVATGSPTPPSQHVELRGQFADEESS
jgi:hypothetical protein